MPRRPHRDAELQAAVMALAECDRLVKGVARRLLKGQTRHRMLLLAVIGLMRECDGVLRLATMSEEVEDDRADTGRPLAWAATQNGGQSVGADET